MKQAKEQLLQSLGAQARRVVRRIPLDQRIVPQLLRDASEGGIIDSLGEGGLEEQQRLERRIDGWVTHALLRVPTSPATEVPSATGHEMNRRQGLDTMRLAIKRVHRRVQRGRKRHSTPTGNLG